ncbi:MAG: hypothetical protein EOO08_07145 [Chitinophagaceae bacterium]|nr:MAG: hypothetical protein EOO08_07145 [Chitinophagaceae bacterium]
MRGEKQQETAVKIPVLRVEKPLERRFHAVHLYAMKNTIFFLTLLLAACSKGGPAVGPPSLAGRWRPVSERANGQEMWMPYYYDPCRLDDQWIFDARGTYTIADSGVHCTTGNSFVRNGLWQLEGSSLLLDSVRYEITNYSEQKLVIECMQNMRGFPVHYERAFEPVSR